MLVKYHPDHLNSTLLLILILQVREEYYKFIQHRFNNQDSLNFTIKLHRSKVSIAMYHLIDKHLMLICTHLR